MVAQNSADFHFFVVMQGNVERVLVLLGQLLGELESLLLKKFIVPAAKRFGAN